MSVIHRGIALCGTGASVLSAGPSKPEKLLYSTLHLETDSSFTGLARRKWDWVSFFSRCLGPARLGVGYRVTLPGENTITAGVKYTQRQACCTVVSVVNSSCLESRFWEWDIHYQSKRHQTFVFTNKDHGICTFFFSFCFFLKVYLDWRQESGRTQSGPWTIGWLEWVGMYGGRVVMWLEHLGTQIKTGGTSRWAFCFIIPLWFNRKDLEQPEFEPMTFLLWSNSANHWASVPPTKRARGGLWDAMRQMGEKGVRHAFKGIHRWLN